MGVLARMALAAALAALLAAPALAQAMPGSKPGVFDYYVLTLSWSPTYCAGGGESGRDPQCAGKRSYAFVLHGLWPQYERGWPESCPVAGRAWVPDAAIARMLDIMPSKRLVIHQYKKHGTCSGLSADAYFDMARELFGRIVIPGAFREPRSPIETTPEEVEAAFLRVNPQLRPEMISVACARRDRLREVRICFSRAGEPTACGRNEDQQRLCSARTLTLPPVRGGSKAGSASSI